MTMRAVRLTLAVSLAVGLWPMHAAMAADPPTFVRTIGGPNRAQMYPSGVEVDDRNGTVVIADTGNNQVARYRPGGRELWRVGRFGTGKRRFQQPRDVGVSRDGDVYVADTQNRRIVILDPKGRWVKAFRGPADDRMGTPIGVTVRDDRVYVADTGRNVLRVFDLRGRQRRVISSRGACSTVALRDADARPDGAIYVASYQTNHISVFGPRGGCLRTFGGTGSALGQLRAPYGVRIARDPVARARRVYVADANNDRIQVFTLSGEPVAAFGEELFSTLRRVAIAPDGTVWGADLWSWQVFGFERTRRGYRPAGDLGRPLASSTASRVFHEPRHLQVRADGSIVVADTVHQSVVVMGADGSFVRRCGTRGSDLGQFNWPYGVAVDPGTGQIWVTDTKQYRMQIITATCDPVARFGARGLGDEEFRWVFGVAIRASDGVAVIADSQNGRLKIHDVASRALLSVYGGIGGGVGRFREPSGVAVAPGGGVWVADTGNDRVVELAVDGAGAVTWVRTIDGLDAPRGVAVGADGRIYVTESGADRVAVLAADGTRLSPLRGFRQPWGVAIGPGGHLFVSDTYRDRIVEYAP